MGKKVFISYSHKQEKWVLDKLVPALHIGGAEVLIDRERFKAGRSVIVQMDDLQDSADVSVLVISNDYLGSKPCMHELTRAVDKDPDFSKGCVIPVILEACILPDSIKTPNPLYIDMCNDKDITKWNLLMQACEADVGADVPHLLEVKNDLCRLLKRNESVNLVVQGMPKWERLIEYINTYDLLDLREVGMDDPDTIPIDGLVKSILSACCINKPVPKKPECLALLKDIGLSKRTFRLFLKRFDFIKNRKYRDNNDLFGTLRLLIEKKYVVLFIESREPLEQLLPKDHLLSTINVVTVELNGGISS